MTFRIFDLVKVLGAVAAIAMAVPGTALPAFAQSAAQETTSAQAAPSETPAGEAAKASAPSMTAYKLDTGDKVKVTVYGEDDLSGEFEIDGSGNVRLPLIGQVKAAGLSVRELEAAVAAALAKGYLVNPKVSVGIVTYRPFTILGEVNKPGEYPYEAGMTVLNAVALGGGYTYRADEDEVYVRRKGSAQEVKLPADDRTPVYPGDTVRVDERIF